MKKRASYNFINLFCFLIIILISGSCGIINKNLPPNETVKGDDFDKYHLTTRNFSMGNFMYPIGVSEEDYKTFPYIGGDITIDVKHIGNGHDDPNFITILILNDGVPVMFSMGGHPRAYTFEYLLVKDDDIEDTTLTFTPEFSVPDLGKVSVLIVGNVKSVNEGNGGGYRGFIVEEMPEGYVYSSLNAVKLENVPAEDHAETMLGIMDEYAYSHSWVSPHAMEPRHAQAMYYMGLNGVKKLDCVFISNFTFAQRTFFLLNGEPLLNPDGSVHLVEWEGGPGLMSLYTLDLNIPEFRDDGINLFQSLTFPLGNVNDFMIMPYSSRFGLELQGTFYGIYGDYMDSY